MAALSLGLTLLLSYLVGAIPFGYLVARGRGVDILKQGSGNIGATNVGRVLGRPFGVLVFALDFAKGAVPVVLARNFAGDYADSSWLEVGAGLAAFLGHLFPVYLGFRGGKGVATGAGVVAVLVPLPFLAALVAWILVLAGWRYVSLASVSAAVVLCAGRLVLMREVDFTDARTLFCFLAAAMVV